MAVRIGIDEFLAEYRVLPVIDVRSPSEYQRGHIPGAVNLPLFSDNERAVVGKTYHLRGREEAVKEGMKAVGPKMQDFIDNALSHAPGKNVIVYCWRGGMRSASIAFLLETAGMKARVLENGYKAYRHYVLNYFDKPFRLVVLGGMTGSGKTEILKALKTAGEQVIDLEGLANHKGSAFGHLGQKNQPTTEHFENLLCETLQTIDPLKPCWIEDESFSIGKISLPKSIFKQIRQSELILIEMITKLRAERLVSEYPGEIEGLKEAVTGIQKRLGHKREAEIIDMLEEGKLFDAAMALLEYYDKLYRFGLDKRPPGKISTVTTLSKDPYDNALLIRKKYYNK